MKIKKILILPDIHAPKQDEAALNAALKFTEDFKPDELVQLGDLCDFSSISRFDIVREKDLIPLIEEIEAANRVLDRLEKSIPRNCKKTLLEGNHDQRPEKYRLNSWDKNVQKVWGRRLSNFDELYHLKERGWNWRSYGEVYTVGHANFTHGWFTNKYHAFKTVSRWFKTLVYGHTHQYQVHSVVGMDRKPVAALSIGTLSRFDLDYLHGVPPNWVNMFAYLYMFNDGTFTLYTPTIINGRFIAEGCVYDGNRQS